MKCERCNNESEFTFKEITIVKLDKKEYKEYQITCGCCQFCWHEEKRPPTQETNKESNGFKTYSIEEIKNFKLGTVIEHALIGKGIVLRDKNCVDKVVIFKTQNKPAKIVEGYPWMYNLKILTIGE